jgi:threonine 3-dehydrogenase
MPEFMQAIVKSEAAPGAELREVPRPEIGPDDVLVHVRAASICGTDLHIYEWDDWAQKRVKPPLVPGHEFCGHVAAVGKNVSSVKEGDFVSAEMHVACGKCLQCRIGEAHICQNVKILGVDAPGAFAEYVSIPESNIWKIDSSIPVDYASLLDPLGNAVHTILAGEIAGRTVAVIGCGPIGLFSIAVARACGSAEVFAIEPNEHRRKLAKQMQADYVLDPTTDDVKQFVLDKTNGTGVDVIAEMSGNPRAIQQGFQIVRMGGRVSLLGIPSKKIEFDLAADVIFKGAVVQGINGRLMYKTWYQMQALLRTGKLNLDPVITDRMPLGDFSVAMQRLKSGESSKIIVYPNSSR